MLDTCALVGAVPPRYGFSGAWVDPDTYFAMARGSQGKGRDVTAMEMTKWFDTNYHYIVPELERGQRFRARGRYSGSSYRTTTSSPSRSSHGLGNDQVVR